jgi:hypothetical protein
VTNPTAPKGPTSATEAHLAQEEASAAAGRKTLLELHQEKLQVAQKKEKEKQRVEGVKRTPWSREAFMEGTKEMGARQASDLFTQAKELTGRFSRQYR